MTELISHAGQRLRMARERLNLTQAQLAELLRVTRSAVSAWESGLRRLDGPAVVALHALFGISSVWLLTGAGAPDVDPSGGSVSEELLRVPMVSGVEAWDGQGDLDLTRRPRSPWPIPLKEAKKLLEASGGGSLTDLIALDGSPGLTPNLPRQAVHLLDVSRDGRRHPEVDGVYLLRSTPRDTGRLVLVRPGAGGWMAFPVGSEFAVPQSLPDDVDLATQILARICLTGWAWSVPKSTAPK